MAAPAFISACAVASLSPIVRPGAGSTSRADAPPERSRTRPRSWLVERASSTARMPAATLASFGIRMAGREPFEPVAAMPPARPWAPPRCLERPKPELAARTPRPSARLPCRRRRRPRAFRRWSRRHPVRPPHQSAKLARWPREPRRECAGDRREERLEGESVKLCGVEPAGQAGDGVELSKQPAHQLVRIVLRAQLIELTEDLGERLVRRCDGAFREVFALGRETSAVLEEFLAVEVGQAGSRSARNPAGLTTRAMRLLACGMFA